MSIELIKLLTAYTFVGVLIFTAVVTSLSLIGIVKFSDKNQQKSLFNTLILEIVMLSVGFFGNLLELDPTKSENKIAQDVFQVKKEKFEEKLAQARSKYDSGDIQSAYSTVNELFSSDELSVFLPIGELFALNGDIATKRSFWTEALESYGPAIKLSPKNISLIISSGNAQRQLQNYEAAETLYQRAFAAQPQNWDVLNGYYNCLRRYAAFLSDEYPKISNLKFQKASEIIIEMENVASDEKQKRMSDIARGSLYWEWKQYDVARATYKHLLDKYPKDNRFKEDFAAILMEMEQFDDAKKLYAELYQNAKRENKIGWYIGSGYAESASKAQNVDKEELNSALDAGLIAISNKPDEPFSYYAVGMLYKRLGNNNEAILSLKRAEMLESSRDTNIHTYDKKRHLMYKSILHDWGVST